MSEPAPTFEPRPPARRTIVAGCEGEPRMHPLKPPRRAAARALRDGLSAPWRRLASEAIMRRLLAWPLAAEARLIALYAGIGSEVETADLIEALIARHGAVALPRALRRERRLEFYRVHSPRDQLHPNALGIAEPIPERCGPPLAPAAIDLILVPGLLFDRCGYRLGYGGGYYDRLLAQAGRPRAVGLAFSPQLAPDDQPLPLDPWDQPVDAILTEQGWIEPDGTARSPETSQR